MTGTDVTPPDNGAADSIVTASPEQPATPRRSPVLPIVGGAIAALFGFALALIVPSGWPIASDTAEIAGLQATQQAQARALDALATQIPEPADTSALTSQIDALRTALAAAEAAAVAAVAAQAQAMADLADRVAAAEQQPLADGSPSPAALSAFAAELKSLRALVDAQQGQGGTAGADLMAMLEQTKAELAAAATKASDLQTGFEQTASRATSRAALLQINAALQTGGPFAGALEDLAAVGVTVPDGLLAVAEGVPSLATLQSGFADPSRAALSAALKATVGDDAMSRISAFVRNQVGARSLTAREGTDPDAILSRADAALQQGDLAAVLAEIETLPEQGRALLADWVALAQTRLTAMTEVANLAAGPDK